MGSSPTTPNPEVLLRLGYDASDVSGLEKARRDVAKYKADAIVIGNQLRQARAKLTAEDTAENRRQLQKQIADLRSALASATSAIRGKRGEERKASLEARREILEELKARNAQVDQIKAQREEVRRLNTELITAQSGLRRATGAVSIFRGSGPGLPDQIAAAIRSSLFETAAIRSLPGFGALAEGAGAARLAGGLSSLGGVAAFGLAAVPLALKEIFGLLKDTGLEAGKFADELDEMGQRAGVSARDLLVFQAIGKTVKLTTQDMVTATRALSAAIVGGGGEDGLENAGNKGAKVLAALGIASHDASGRVRGFMPVLEDLADAFVRLPDGPEKTRIAVELLGRSGQNFIPFLNKGREGIRAFLASIQDFLPELAGTAKLFDELEQAQARYELATLGLKNSLSQSVIPTVTRFTNELAALLVIWKEFGASGVLSQLLTGQISGEPRPSLTQFGRNIGVRNNRIEFRGDSDESLFNAALGKITENERSGRDKFFVTGFDEQGIRQLFTDLQKVRGGDARQNLFNEFLRQGRIEIREQITAEKDLSGAMDERLKKLREIWAGDKTENEVKRQAAQLEEAQKREVELRADLEKSIADAAIKLAQTEQERFAAATTRREAVEQELAGLRERAVAAKEVAQDESRTLTERNKAQAVLNDSIKRASELIKEQTALTKEQADALGDLLKDAPLPKRKLVPLAIGGTPTPQSGRDFDEELAALRVKEALGVKILGEELEVRKALNTALIEQIRLRLAAGVATKEERAALEELLRDLKANREALGTLRKDQFNQSSLGVLLSSFKQISDIVGKFSAALNRGLGQAFATAEGIAAIFKQISALSPTAQKDAQGNVIPGTGSFSGGIRAIFSRSSGLNAGQRASGIIGLLGSFAAGISQLTQPGTLNKALGGANLGGLVGSFAGPIGAAVGAALGAALGTVFTTKNPALGALSGALIGGPIGGILGGLFASRRKETAKIAKQIREDVKNTLTSFNEGSKSIKDTIAALERERADAVTRLSGKKGGKKELQAITDDIDKALTDLRRKQKEVLDSFQSQLGLLRVGEGMRDAAQSVQQIATALKQAADAGASAADQVDFLNLALADLKNKIGRDLRDEEQATIDLLLQSIDLQKQREQILEDAAERERNVRRSLGLERALTPEQSAAKQIAAIRKQRDEQLKALDEQQARLNAELEGRAELFDLNLEGLDVDAQRTALVDRQLVLQREITAELVAQIQAQQSFFADLAAGRIPALPAGVLPSGFAAPAGSNFTIGSVQIVVGSGVTPSEAEEIGRGVLAGLMRQARIRGEQGFAS